MECNEAFEGFLQNEMTPSYNCLGDSVSDIPSFVELERNGKKSSHCAGRCPWDNIQE